MDKKIILFSLLALVFFGIVTFVNAQTVVPYVEPEILGEFNKSSEVPIIVQVKDTSGITVTAKDSEEEQLNKDSMKRQILGDKVNLVLSTLPETEFRLNQIFPFRNGFYGRITKQGFDRLVNNSDIELISFDSSIGIAAGEIVENDTIYQNISTLQKEQELEVIKEQKSEIQSDISEPEEIDVLEEKNLLFLWIIIPIVILGIIVFLFRIFCK